MCKEEKGRVACPSCDEGFMEYDPDMHIWNCTECDYTEDRGD
jgi:ribosomal protein L37AE/L43A